VNFMMKNGNSDIAEVLERVRARLRPQVEAEIRAGDRMGKPTPSQSADIGALQLKLGAIISAHRQVGIVNPRHPGPINRLIQTFKTSLRRILTWYTRPLVEFQACTIQFLSETAKILARGESRLDTLEQNVELLRTDLADLRQLIESKLDPTTHDQDKFKRG